MGFAKEFDVANPAPYERNDYVEVDLDSLGVPSQLNECNLKLIRLGDTTTEIPYQLDHVFGRAAGKRIMTFFSRATPAGPEDYSRTALKFRLEEGTPKRAPRCTALRIEHHYQNPDEMLRRWDEQRQAVGVMLSNESMDVYFRLAPLQLDRIAYCGSATSFIHKRAEKFLGIGEVLKPFGFEKDASFQGRWGQLTHLDFYSLPWEPRWYQTVLLSKDAVERKYSLAWSNCGPHRAIVVMKSEPFEVNYRCEPFLDNKEVKIKCHLYRIISSYCRDESSPSFYNEFYSEQLCVRYETDVNVSLAFRAHFRSHLEIPGAVSTDNARLEQIPDYFAIWKKLTPLIRVGYGVASDSHIRAFRSDAEEISWRLQLGHNHRCVHYFLLETYPDAERVDLLHTIGHSGWYERCFKPLQVVFPGPSRIDCYLAPRDEAE